MPDRSAVVIGAGIGGLAAALELRRSGYEVSVFESRDELSEVNTGLSLWAFGACRLSELGLGEEMAALGSPIERVVHRDPSGRLLGEVDVTGLNARIGSPSYEINRSKLQVLLAEHVGDEAIAFGRRCFSAETGGTKARALFEDGSDATGDLLVGADGVHSAVRRAIFPATQLRRSQVGVWRGMAAIGGDELPAGDHVRFMGPARLFGIAHIGEGLSRWYAGAKHPAEPPRSKDEIKRLALDRFKGWPPLVDETLSRTAEEDYLFNDTPHAAPLKGWGRGRITLLGDAGHSSLPTLGISAGLAIEDAAVLGESLRLAGDVTFGLRSYEKERRRVTARVVRAAALFGRVLMVERQPAYAVRQAGLRLAPQRLAVSWLVRGARGSVSR